MGHYSRRSESQPRAVVLGVARRARRGVAGTRAGPSTTDSRWWLTCTSTSAIEISEHSLLGMCGLVLSTVRRPNCRTSYENVAGQGVTARGSLRKPRPDRIPARARLTAHRKSASWASSTGWSNDKLALSVERSPLLKDRHHRRPIATVSPSTAITYPTPDVPA